jgi:glycosyltransferase involved in cell wall biosynthesis
MTSHSGASKQMPPGAPARRPGYVLVIPWGLDATGGVTQVVRNLYQELACCGWSPTVLVSSWSERAPVHDEIDGIHVIRWRLRSPWSHTGTWRAAAAYILTLPIFMWRWRRLARAAHVEVVNVHYPGTSVLSWALLRRLGLWRGKVVVSVHGLEVRSVIASGGTYQKWLMRNGLRMVDLVVACSRELAEDTRQLTHLSPDRLATVPNGVAPARLREQLAAHPSVSAALQGRRYILNLATFEEKKAQDVLVDAFARLVERFTDLDLVLAGRTSSWMEFIRERAEALGVSDRVHTLGDIPHAHVPALLSGASVFCLPSRAEGHPLAVLEAGALGVPVVATSIGGIQDTIPGDQYGLIVPKDDVSALADALQRLLSDPSLAESVGRNLQERVVQEFSWARTAQQYTALLRARLEVPSGAGLSRRFSIPPDRGQ